MNSLVKALLSPRFTRNSDSKSEIFVKTGDIMIVDKNASGKESGQKVHMRLVRQDLNLTAKFYTDSKMSYCLGILAVEKCIISRSSTDLTKIEVSRRRDERTPLPGLLIKTKSEEDALRWIEAMSPEEHNNMDDL